MAARAVGCAFSSLFTIQIYPRVTQHISCVKIVRFHAFIRICAMIFCICSWKLCGVKLSCEWKPVLPVDRQLAAKWVDFLEYVLHQMISQVTAVFWSWDISAEHLALNDSYCISRHFVYSSVVICMWLLWLKGIAYKCKEVKTCFFYYKLLGRPER